MPDGAGLWCVGGAADEGEGVESTCIAKCRVQRARNRTETFFFCTILNIFFLHLYCEVALSASVTVERLGPVGRMLGTHS